MRRELILNMYIRGRHVTAPNGTMQFTILFNPTARVYNLRFLLLANIATIVLFGLPDNFEAPIAIQVPLTLAWCSVIILHHIIV